MTEPKGLLDLALAGVKNGKVYDLGFPNGLNIRTDESEVEHQRVRETLADLTKTGVFSPPPSLVPTPSKAGLLSERIENFLKQMRLRRRPPGFE